jgi:hypothetical protein
VADNNITFSVTAQTEQVQASLGQMDAAISASMTHLNVQVNQAARETGSAMQKMAKGMGDASKDVAKSFDEAGMKATGAAQVIGGSLSAIPNPYAQAAGALITITDGVKGSLLQLEQAAQQSHMGTVEFVELKDAMQAAQVPTEHLPEQLGSLSKAINEAAHGSGTARTAFQQLGISTDAWKNRIPSTDEVLLKLADHFKGGKVSAEGLAAAHRLLGASASELIPYLKQGSAAILEQRKAHKDNAEAVNDAINDAHKLQAQEDALSEQLQTLLLPVFEAVVKAVQGLAVAFMFLKRVWQSQADLIIGSVMGMLHTFQGLGKVLKDIFTGNWSAVADDSRAMAKRVEADGETIIAKLKQDWTGFGTQVKNVFADLPKAAAEADGGVTGNVDRGAKKRTAIVQLENRANVIDHKAADEQIVSDANAILGQLPGVEQSVDSNMLASLTQYASNTKVVFAKATADIELSEKQSLGRRKQQWNQFFQGINSAFSSFTKSLLSGHQTLSQAWSKLVDGMASKFLSGLEKQLMGFLQQKLMEINIHESAEATKSAVSEASHATEDKRTAFSAAKHAYDSVVDTPIVGPVLAPLAAAAAFAAVSTFGSAAGGQYLVPGPQLTMLHAQEMVLPAGLAGRMRDVVEGRAGGGGVTVVVNHTVTAVDAQSFQGMIRQHGNMIGNEVARVLKKKGFSPA